MFFKKKSKELDNVPVPPSLSPEDTEKMLSESLDEDLNDLPPMPDDLLAEKVIEEKPSKKVKKEKKKKEKKVKDKKKDKKVKEPKVEIKDVTEELLEKSFDDPTLEDHQEISLDNLDNELKAIEKSISATESALSKIDADLAKINKKL